jgi:hypothetical protein
MQPFPDGGVNRPHVFPDQGVKRFKRQDGLPANENPPMIEAASWSVKRGRRQVQSKVEEKSRRNDEAGVWRRFCRLG